MLWQKCSKFIGSPRLQALLAVQTAAVHAMLALLKVTNKIKLMKYIPEVEMPRMQLYNSCFNEDVDIKSKPGSSSEQLAEPPRSWSTKSKKSSGTTSRTPMCRHSFLSFLCLSFATSPTTSPSFSLNAIGCLASRWPFGSL